MTRYFVFVDNNASPLLAATLHPLLERNGTRAVHIRHVEALGPRATDVMWIQYLHQQVGEWIALSGDLRMAKNRPEREALRSAKARVLFLSKGFLKQPVHRQCALLLWNWPQIEQHMAPLVPPVLLEIGPRIRLSLKPVPL